MVKMLRYLRPYRLMVAMVLALVFLQSLSELYLPTLMADIVDHGIVTGDTPYIWKIGGFMLAVSAAGIVFTVTASYLSAKVASGYGRDIRRMVFSHAEKFSLSEFDQVGTASLITRSTNDITQVQQVLLMMMRMMVMAPMLCIGGIIMAVSKDAKLSLLLVAILPILGLTIYLIASRTIPLFKSMQVKVDKINLVMRESLSGIRVIRAFNRTEHQKQRFDEANLDLTNTAIRVNQIMAAMMPVMMLIMNITSISIIWFGGLRIDSGHMQVGDLMAFLQYAMQILFSLMMVSMMFVMIPRASASAVRIREVLDIKPVITDDIHAIASVSKDEDVADTKTIMSRGHVQFDNVTFSYPGAEMPALSNISFEARPGEVTAIIGGTGAGKTTLINLIPRFYDIQDGSIRIDGTDIRELTQERLRSDLGLIPQQALLFTGSVADNIRFGKNDATIDEIRHAAEVAQASEFINGLENSYDAPVSQGGTNLSGGQKQRLSIARAIVRKPGIYLFDDSFSALDFRTDANLRAALKPETADSTVIIVAQRVSTVMDADQIIVLDEGRISDIGTHRELLESSSIYREIVSSQLSEEEIA